MIAFICTSLIETWTFAQAPVPGAAVPNRVIEHDNRPRTTVKVVFTDNDDELNPKMVQVGEQETGVKTKYTLELVNQTSKPLRIVGISPQCGCTELVSVPPPIEVGGTAPLIVLIEPTKPYLPGMRYRIDLQIEGRKTPVTLMIASVISDAIGLNGPAQAIFRVPPTWAANVKAERVDFQIELFAGSKVNLEKLDAVSSPEINFIQWSLEALGPSRLVMKGFCDSSEVPPDTTRGTVYVVDKATIGEAKHDMTNSKLTIPIQVINPLPVSILPSSISFTKDEESDFWIGKSLVRLDPVLLRSPDSIPQITLVAPARGSLQSKKVTDRLYDLQIQLLLDTESKKLPKDAEISVTVSGGEYNMKIKVD